VAKWDDREKKIAKRKKQKQHNQSNDNASYQKKKIKRTYVPNDNENLEY
tara:strand:- start:60 stop:206 length:147 start_codon:yes stop_codon:yes gene_type:complete